MLGEFVPATRFCRGYGGQVPKKVPKRDLRINNKRRAPSAAQNLRMRAEIQNGETASQTHRLRDNSARHCPPPESSRLQADKHPAGVNSPEVRCFDPGFQRKTYSKQEMELGCERFAGVANVFGSRALSAVAGCAADTAATTDVRVQAAASPSSNRSTPRISGSIFSSRKLGACSGHCTLQRVRADKIGFVEAIPCRCSNLCKQEPAQGCGEIGTGDL